MKRYFLSVFAMALFVQFSVFAADKADREMLLEAFDGKFVLIDGQSQQACFSLQGNIIEIVKHPGKCDNYINISISRRGALCLENKKKSAVPE